MITKHVKPRRQGEPGGRIEKEGTIHVSNVKLVCPKCKASPRASATCSRRSRSPARRR